MKITALLCGVALLATPFISTSCSAQKPKISEVNGLYSGRWEIDAEVRQVKDASDAARRAIVGTDWVKQGVAFEVESEGESAILVGFQDEKLRLELKKIKREKDDGVVEHEVLLALDVASVSGKTFAYKSDNGDLDITFTILRGNTEYESFVKADSKFDLPEKEFDGEYIVDCKGSYKGEQVSFEAQLEIEFRR